MKLTPDQVLDMIPQRPPFRFLDRLISLDEQGATGEVTFTGEEPFYRGHFPAHPVTPGVLLIEAMCQTGLVALGLYLLALEAPPGEVGAAVTLFTETESVEFLRRVLPPQTLTVRAERVYWRRRKLKSRVALLTTDGETVARGVVSGLGVSREL